MVERQTESLKRIPFNRSECRQLLSSAFWMKFIAILIAIVAVLNLVSLNITQLVQIIGAVFLWRAAGKLKLVVDTDDADQIYLGDALVNIRNYFLFKGIMTIGIAVIALVAVFVGFAGAA